MPPLAGCEEWALLHCAWTFVGLLAVAAAVCVLVVVANRRKG